MRIGSSSIARGGQIAVSLAVLVASCTPFASGDDTASGAGGDASTPVDASGATDQNAPGDGAVAFDASEGSAADGTDGGKLPPDGGFCAAFPTAIHCFDFDEPAPLTALALTQTGGTATVAPGFVGGSAPSALVVATTMAGGHVTATPTAIDLALHKNTTLTVEFVFTVAKAATATEYVARLNFPSTSVLIAFNALNGLGCGGGTYPAVSPGKHALSVSMPVDGAGTATSISCSLDGVSSLATLVASTASVSVELGNVSSGSGSFTVAYDNVLVRAQ